MEVSWDEVKDRANQKKHGISFQQASELFTSDADYLEIYDATHSEDEDRFIAIGLLAKGLVLVVFTVRDDTMIRVISARWATRRERELYRQYMERRR